MIGKMIGALVGGRGAEHARGVGGPTGAVLGVVAASALRRISLPTMIALGAGGYFAKKYFDRQQADDAKPKALEDKSVSTTKAKTGEPVSA